MGDGGETYILWLELEDDVDRCPFASWQVYDESLWASVDMNLNILFDADDADGEGLSMFRLGQVRCLYRWRCSAIVVVRAYFS